MRALYDLAAFAFPATHKAGIYTYALRLLAELTRQDLVRAGTYLGNNELYVLARRGPTDWPEIFSLLDPSLLLAYERLDSPCCHLFPWSEGDPRSWVARGANHHWRVLMTALERGLQKRRLVQFVGQADLVHFLCFNALDIPLPKVATIHDVITDLHPEWFPPKHVRHMHTVMDYYKRHVDRYICVSETTRQDFLARYKVAPEHVSVVYPGVNTAYYPEPEQAAALAFLHNQHIGDDPYWVCLATLEPRKNHAAIIRAFAALHADTRYGNTHLVVIGGKGWGLKDPLNRFLPSSHHRYLHETDYLPQPLIRGILSRAQGLVFPTLYEGFGSPPVEAMACGCPVVASRLGALPEVLGEYAEYVDASNDQDIARGMARLVDDPARRAMLRQGGLGWVQRYSYARAARETHAVYEELCRKS